MLAETWLMLIQTLTNAININIQLIHKLNQHNKACQRIRNPCGVLFPCGLYVQDSGIPVVKMDPENKSSELPPCECTAITSTSKLFLKNLQGIF